VKSCERGNEISCPVKGAELFGQLSDYQVLNTDSGAR